MCEIYTFQTKLNTNIKFEKNSSIILKHVNVIYFTLLYNTHTHTHSTNTYLTL